MPESKRIQDTSLFSVLPICQSRQQLPVQCAMYCKITFWGILMHYNPHIYSKLRCPTQGYIFYSERQIPTSYMLQHPTPFVELILGLSPCLLSILFKIDKYYNPSFKGMLNIIQLNIIRLQNCSNISGGMEDSEIEKLNRKRTFATLNTLR